jgi:transcriptional regulator with XRE-family HTH domain
VLDLQSDCPLRIRLTVGCEQPIRSPMAFSPSLVRDLISASSWEGVSVFMSTHSIRERIFVNARMNSTLTQAIHACIVASMDKKKTIGDRLDELMQSHTTYGRRGGQSALARATGVPQPTINRILSNKSIPESETARKLALAFGVSITWLLSGEGPQYIKDLEDASMTATGSTQIEGMADLHTASTGTNTNEEVTENMHVREILSLIRRLQTSDKRDLEILKTIKGLCYLLTSSHSAEDTTREDVETKAKRAVESLKRASKESESGHGTATKRGAGRRHKP